MLKQVLGGILATGANPNVDGIESVESADSKADYTPFITLGAGIIIFLGILFFVSKMK